MKDRQKNPQRADKIWNRRMLDKNFKQTARKKWTEMMRPVKDGRQTKSSEGRKQTKFQTGKTERGTEQAKFQRAQQTHRQKTEDRQPIFQSVRPNNSQITCQKR